LTSLNSDGFLCSFTLENPVKRIAVTLYLSLAMLLMIAPPQSTAQEVKPAQSNIIGIKSEQNIRVAYDIKDNLLDAGIGKGLYYVRGLLES